MFGQDWGERYVSRTGEPSHFVLLRLVWREFCSARSGLHCEERRPHEGPLHGVMCERMHARCLTLSLLLDELLEMCLVNDWPIPPGIERMVSDGDEEGQ